MRPDAPKVLDGVAASLRSRVLPDVLNPFAQQTLNTAAGLIGMIAQHIDGAVARLVEENDALRGIFIAARDVVVEPGLRGRLAQAGEPTSQSDLRLSSLQRENDALRALLIDLHAHVETIDVEAARRLDRRIWEELRESTRRRHLQR